MTDFDLSQQRPLLPGAAAGSVSTSPGFWREQARE